ncbi:MAG TPA: Na+/H+ antiporter NhaA [Steroidobacteraceae bacterium]|nr:Na+/H+ antiporter NhaA [Steroidobacteraceae bacterium]
MHQTFRRFIQSEQFGGVLLLACTVVSLALANSPLSAPWLALWHLDLGPLSVEHWINDALMAVFFLMIGLELERGIYVGALSSVRNALLPAFAAVGGMAAPALIHFALNGGTATESGFGVPMATDIAFALAVIALLGPRVPGALKLFIVAFAIIDDLGAIVLIATVYTAELSFQWLGLALGVWSALIALNLWRRSMSLWPYLGGGVMLWYCVYNAGVHASIAGVMLAFAIPFSPRDPEAESPSHRLERRLHKPVAYLILPLFALANTGVPVDAQAIAELSHANSIGIALGLLIGKPLGVVAMCAVAVWSGVCSLPAEVRWAHIVGAGLLGGIGFTMSIFITNLAFADHAAIVNSSKLAVLGASLVAGMLGLLWLRLAPKWGHS